MPPNSASVTASIAHNKRRSCLRYSAERSMTIGNRNDAAAARTRSIFARAAASMRPGGTGRSLKRHASKAPSTKVTTAPMADARIHSDAWPACACSGSRSARNAVSPKSSSR